MFYTVMGVILLGMACIGAVLFIWQDMRDRRNTMPWKKRPPKKGYSEEFLASIEKAYEAAGSIRGMLQIMEEKYPKEKRRAEIALAYLVLIMSVHPGFGGQSFIPSSLEKIRETRALLGRVNSTADIEVDGGIYTTNVREVLEAGANVIVAGSAIFRGDAAENTKNMMEILRAYE